MHLLSMLLATTNRGKARELTDLLALPTVRLVMPGDMGLTLHVDEYGTTFAENARLKALAGLRASGLPSLGDDSGLEVPALNNEPGILSARYAGPDSSDEANRAKLLTALEGKTGEDRQAVFRCVLAFAASEEDILEAHGECWGRLATVETGTDGFGYDALFVPDGQELTFAQLPLDTKNEISHRGRAAAEMRLLLQIWLRRHPQGWL